MCSVDRAQLGRFRERPGALTGPTPRLGEALVERGLLNADDLERALELQQRAGDRLGRIVMALGLVRRWQLYQVLSELWGCPFVDLLREPVDGHLARRFDPQELVLRRCIPIGWRDGVVVVATSERPTPELDRFVQGVLGQVAVKPVVTTDWDIDHAIRQTFRDTLLDRATMQLHYRNPDESARSVLVHWQRVALVVVVSAAIAGLLFATLPTLVVLVALVNLGFLAGVIFRFVVSMQGAQFEHIQAIRDEEVAELRDEDLPTYTVLVPVYREGNVVSHLVDSLRRLDYPASKLEVLLLLEEDDDETLAAARAAKPPETVTFVVVPNGQPKTKPKACNVGLFFARGEYLVIYDAEDRPEPDQLKKAVIAFRKGPPELVCVQAALNYYNATENVLTRMFTLEYSYWFDYMLPGLDRLRLPIPLGGTSNHFRTDRLRQLGGWDPFNVTEDADLGLRAAAEGFKVGVINSTTYEEANCRYGNWIRQRSRWIKGYMQTILVHTRHPVRLVRATGWRNLLGFVMLVGGTPLTFLCAPFMWALFLAWLIVRSQMGDPLFPPGILYVSLFNLLIGNGLMIYLNMLAVFKRKLYGLIPFSLLNPLYWVLHSVAAYKALIQLVRRPFYWEKTVHGLSRHFDDATSRPVSENVAG